MKRNRKALSKIASVMLILAICITTVFGGIESVFAAAADATYTVDVEKTIVPFGDRGTAYITFNLESGFVSGNFTLLENFVEPRYDEVETTIEKLIEEGVIPADAGITFDNYKTSDYLEQILQHMAQWTYEFEAVNVTVYSGTPVSGTFNAADFAVTNKMYSEDGTRSPNNTERHKYDRLSDVSFSSGTKAYKSVTFQLDYEYEYHVRVGADNPTVENGIRLAHAKYSTDELDQCTDGGYRNLEYKDPTLVDAAGEEHTASKNQPEGTYDFFHAHRWDWRRKNPIHTNVNGYYIYEAQCTLCDMTHHQVGAKYTSQGQSHNYYEISGINVVYEANGTVSVNVHVPTVTQNEELVICKMDGTPTKYGSIVVTPENYNEVLTDSYYAKAQAVDEEGNIVGYGDNILPHGTKMYTIKGLSATDLKSEIMLTRLVDKMYLGSSHPFSLQEYAAKVITGEDVYYPEATTEAQKAADKEVAAAFVNYAVNASNALDNKINSKPKSTVKWSGQYTIKDEAAFLASLGDEDGKKGTGTEDDPYIIDTPEQLFYVACYAGANSKDKYYKVSDFVGKFDMGAYDFEASVDTIKSTVNRTWGAHNNNANDNPFQGHFDGNGVIIYGLAGRAWQTGLFPKVGGTDTGTVSTVSIKNLTVLSSSFIVTGNNAGAGAIIGVSNAHSNVTVENCAVKWCYFDSEPTASGMGTIIGVEGHTSHVEINNCIVLENFFDADSTHLWPYGGFTGYAYSYGNTYRSSIAIGNAPYSTVHDTGAYDSTRPHGSNAGSRYDNTFHGVYTDKTAAYFCGYYSSGKRIDVSAGSNDSLVHLEVEQMTGEDIKATMPYLDWSQWFTVNDGIPRLRNFDQSGNAQDDVIVWDGTIATDFEGGSGTATDPYIIADPSQLAYLVSGAGATGTDYDGVNTKGKYFKVADGIAAFDMNGFKNISLYSTVENLEKGAVNTDKTKYNWNKLNASWGATSWFSGNFDGNHVRIFNLYCEGASAALFPYANNQCTIKNVSVENSYIKATSSGGSYGAGGIVGAYRKTHTSEDKQSYIEGCTVRDCYILNTNAAASDTNITAAHAVGNATWIETHITNCFFANNTLDVSAAKMSDGTTSPYAGGVVGNANEKSILTGVVVVSHTGRNDSLVKTGFIGGYTNYTLTDCYTTDSTVDTLMYDGVTILQGGYNDILGGSAVVNMPSLHWGSVWYSGQPGKYPALYDDGIANIPTAITELLNADVRDEQGVLLVDGWDNFVATYNSQSDDTITTTDPDLNMYSSVGINLKDNPYLIVTFEIAGQYAEAKDKVEATFTVGDQTITVKGSEMINNAGAGRYHAVRLKDIDVINLHKDINVTVSFDGTEIVTGTIGIKGFIYDAYRSGPEYEYYALAAKSLIYYSQVLNARAIIKEQTPPIVTTDAEYDAVKDTGKDYVVVGGTFAKTISADGVNVTIKGATLNSGSVNVVAASNGGTMTIEYATAVSNPNRAALTNINGGTIIINDGEYSAASIAMGNASGSLIINGGTFNVSYINGMYGMGVMTIGSVTITGGTFSINPSNGANVTIPTGYQVVQNADGTYTVKKS